MVATAPSWTLGAVSLTTYPFSVPLDEYDPGSPERASDVLASFLTDGDIEISGKAGNRTVSIPVLLEGSLSQIAAAEATLLAEVTKPQNRLLVDPGDGVAPAAWFSVFGGALVWNRDDSYERNGYRRYTLTMKALPFVYSAALTSVAALSPPPASPTTTVVDACASTTGWTAAVTGAGSLASFAVGSGSGGSGDQELVAQTGAIFGAPQPTRFGLTRAGSVMWGTTRYVSFDFLYTTSYGYSGQADDVSASVVSGGSVVGLDLLSVNWAPAPFGAYLRATFVVPAAVTTSTSLALSINTTANQDSIRAIHLTQVSRSNQPPFAGTTMQQSRAFTVGGSAPTVGSVAVSDASKALGDATMVFTYQAPDAVSAAYSPPCSLWRVSGPARSADPSAVSGSSVALGGTESYEIPLTSLPAGVYAVVARMKASAAGSYGIGLSYGQKMGGVLQGTEFLPHAVALGTSYQSVVLGMKQLPTLDAAATATSLQCIYVGWGGSGTVTLDEVWLFNMTIGRLTQVDLGSASPAAGGASSQLWIDSPSLANDGLGGLFRGFATDRSDAISAFPNAAAPGVHEFQPGLNKIFTVTPNTATSVAGFSYYKAWLHNAAS